MLSPALKNMLLLVGSVVFFYLWNEAVVIPYQTPKTGSLAELQKMKSRPQIINTLLVGLAYLSWMLGSFALIRLWELAAPEESKALEKRFEDWAKAARKRLNAWSDYLLSLRKKV